MFQWSTNRRRTAQDHSGTTTTTTTSATPASTYPAYRSSEPVTSIQGSIRPPGGITRQQHWDSYLKDSSLSRSTRKIPPGDSTYETVFQTIKNDTLLLRVHWETSAAAPTCILAGIRAQHEWLDPHSMRVIGYDPLRQWTTSSSATTLGQVVHGIIKQFQLHPPLILEFVDPQLKRAAKTEPASSTASAASSHSTQPPPPPDYFSTVLPGSNSHSNSFSMSSSFPQKKVDIPPIPSQFEELKSLDREALDDLLQNELEFQSFCHQLGYFRDTLQPLSVSVLDDNVATARDHVQDDTLPKLREQAQRQQKELSESVQEFRKLEKEQAKYCPAPPEPRKVIRDLQRAKKEAFDQSEELADTWLEDDGKGMSVESFVQDFLTVRQLHHERAAKLELMERR